MAQSSLNYSLNLNSLTRKRKNAMFLSNAAYQQSVANKLKIILTLGILKVLTTAFGHPHSSANTDQYANQ